MGNDNVTASPAALIVFVAPRGSAEALVESAKEAHAVGRSIILGHGTASKEIWEMLGITIDRDVVFCATLFSRVDAIMETVIDRLDMRKPGNGMAFVVSIEKIIGKGVLKRIAMNQMFASGLITGLNDGIDEEIKQKVGMKMSQISAEKREAEDACPLELVIVRMANGYGQEVMSCAKKAGATGGTIVHGRTSTDTSAVKFFNITIEPECDILFMLVDKTKTDHVLDSIAEQWGPRTSAHAFGFVLPVIKTFIGAQ